MRIFSLAFLAGIVLLQNFSFLPDKKWVWIILLLAVVLSSVRCLRWLSALFLGFSWCLWFALAHSADPLAKKLEGNTLILTGQIVSIPEKTEQRSKFLFYAKQLHGLTRLSWQPAQSMLHVGDEWQLQVRLKRIHGSMNPGGFDYEARAFQEGIKAQGYVVARGENKLLSQHWYYHLLDRMREWLNSKIVENLPVTRTSPWIPAFVIGVRQDIAPPLWEVLRNTGTNHLMAIAGLHIGFMSGFVYFLVAWLWRRVPRLALKLPAQHAGSIAALIMALLYSALAGFSIPTQRACVMLSVFLIVVLLRRKIRPWHAWSSALLLVLLLNPLSVLTESFWLSFGAAALIIFGISGRLAPSGWWWKWGRVQWVIAVGLVPFSVWLFQQCSIVSFLANSMAIPCVGFLIVPLCLVGSFLLLFSVKLGGLLLGLADKILGVLWIVLEWFSHLSWGSWYQVLPSYWVLVVACIGVIVLLLPVGFPGRYLGCVGLLPLFFYQPDTPKKDSLWLTLLDVGQGLAVVVQTERHNLVFDTGAKLSASFDMGESVVVPFLRAAGIKSLDMLVISHRDNDHIGGAATVLKRVPVKSIKTSVPAKLPDARTSYCLRGEKWSWDGIGFEFLYPTLATLDLNNDSSCVLRISAGKNHILLTGDIEKFAERNLLQAALPLSADILVAPHHGSKTSGEIEFIYAVDPRYVLFPIGYRNRYHFPHASVVAKYTELGVKKIDTATAGAIRFEVSVNEGIKDPELYRVVHRRYWNSSS